MCVYVNIKMTIASNQYLHPTNMEVDNPLFVEENCLSRGHFPLHDCWRESNQGVKCRCVMLILESICKDIDSNLGSKLHVKNQ